MSRWWGPLILALAGLMVSPWATADAPRAAVGFAGELVAGERFERRFGPGFRFALDPLPHGWLLVVRDKRDGEDLARLTPPFHFAPNPREIEGWHFRNADNSGPNAPGPKNVNAPGELRKFVFSAPARGGAAAREFGRGEFRILEYRLKDLEADRRASFAWMRFEVHLSWPAGYRP